MLIRALDGKRPAILKDEIAKLIFLLSAPNMLIPSKELIHPHSQAVYA